MMDLNNRRAGSALSEINITPFVDVVLFGDDFDVLVKKVYQCTRMLGFQLCFYIDDRFSAYACRGAARSSPASSS